MLIIDLLSWWYIGGWSWVAKTCLVQRNQDILEFFSVKDLTKTLFAPFRQTFVGGQKGSIGDKLRGLVDSFISRLIGLVVRLALVLFALILLILNTAAGVLVSLAWPVLPLLPIIGVVLMFAGGSNGV